MVPFLVQLSENDKRLIFAILIIFIFVFVLIGYIGYLITRVMKWQGRKLDTLVGDVLQTRVITTKKHFFRYARKKNWRYFFKQAWIPLLIILTGFIILIIRNAIAHDFSYNPFNKETGFGSLLFLWDFSGVFKREGGSMLVSWPVLVNSPHFVLEAWGGYLFTIFILVGGVWYLIVLQALISRTIRMFVLSTKAFEKNLDDFNQNVQYPNNPNGSNNAN